MGGEASGATAAQIELNKKREAEVTKIRRDLEETQIQQEATIVGLKKKHQDANAEMQEQIEQLNKMRSKIEKDKTLIMHETADVRAATDEVNRSKAAAENGDLLRQLQELENSANMLAKLKLSLADQLSEARAVADNEAKERQSLLGKFRNAEHDVAGMKDHFDEEVSSKENIGRQLSKATADQLQAKLAQVEKAKSKISAEIEGMAGQLDQAQILNSSMEKKAKQFDRIVGEWKQKVDGIGMDLDNAQKETRNA